MKLNLSKEWYESAAANEDGKFVSAGVPDMMYNIEIRVNELLELKENWDNEGAKPIQKDIAESFLNFTKEHENYIFAAYYGGIYPTHKGGLQLEIDNGNRSLELEFISPNEIYFLKHTKEDFEEDYETTISISDERVIKLFNWVNQPLDPNLKISVDFLEKVWQAANDSWAACYYCGPSPIGHEERFRTTMRELGVDSDEDSTPIDDFLAIFNKKIKYDKYANNELCDTSFPKEVQIDLGGSKLNIHVKEKLNIKKENALGYFHPDNNEISIKKSQQIVGMWIVLIHELLHCAELSMKDMGVTKRLLGENVVEHLASLMTGYLASIGRMPFNFTQFKNFIMEQQNEE